MAGGILTLDLQLGVWRSLIARSSVQSLSSLSGAVAVAFSLAGDFVEVLKTSLAPKEKVATQKTSVQE